MTAALDRHMSHLDQLVAETSTPWCSPSGDKIVAFREAPVAVTSGPDASPATSDSPPIQEWRPPEPLRFEIGVRMTWVTDGRCDGDAIEGVLLYASRLMLIVEHAAPDPDGFGITVAASRITLSDLRTVDGDRVCMHRRLQLATLLAAVTLR